MFVLTALISRFDDALDWPEDPFIGDDDPIDNWAPSPTTPPPLS